MNANFSDTNTELGRSSMHQMNKERYEKQISGKKMQLCL